MKNRILVCPVLTLLLLSVGCGRNEDGTTDTATRDTTAQSTRSANDTAPASPRPSTSASGPATTAPATTRAAQGSAGQSQPPDRLFGTWVARDVDAAMGEVKIKLVFRREGPMSLMAWSDIPLVGQVRDKEAPFEATANTIHSDAIRGGTTVNYHINDQGQLIIEYRDGKTVTFSRAS
jgi:hypothetical protein